MSDIKFNCPHCQQSLEASHEMLGQVVDCPACTKPIEIPLRKSLALVTSNSATPPVSKSSSFQQPSATPKTEPCLNCGANIPLGAAKCLSCGNSIPNPDQAATFLMQFCVPFKSHNPHSPSASKPRVIAFAAILALLAPLVGFYIFRILDNIDIKEEENRTRDYIYRDQAAAQGIPPISAHYPHGTLEAITDSIKTMFIKSPKDKLIGEWKIDGPSRTTYILSKNGNAKMILDNSVIDGPTINGKVFWMLNYDRDPMCLDFVMTVTGKQRSKITVVP